MISLTYLFFINYFLHLITPLCPRGLLVQRCWAGFPQYQTWHKPCTGHLARSSWGLVSLSYPFWASGNVTCSSLCSHVDLNGSLVLLRPTCMILPGAAWNRYTTPRIFSKACPTVFPFSLKQLVSARMQRLQDCWCSTMQIPTIAAIGDGPRSMRLSPETTWRSWISLWKGVPRLSQQMPTASLPYLWQLRVGSWKLWDTLQDVVSIAYTHLFI